MKSQSPQQYKALCKQTKKLHDAGSIITTPNRQEVKQVAALFCSSTNKKNHNLIFTVFLHKEKLQK
jgi:hypothetical protein